MKTVEIIIITIIFVIFIYQLSILCLEHFTENFNDQFANQAVQNIASVYAESSGIVTFNNVKVTGNLDVSGIGNCLPPGSIIAYNDTTAPPGWVLCDGSNNTPDLRGRFIRMWYSRKGDSIWGDMLPVNMPNANADGSGNSEKIKSSSIGDGSSFQTAMMNHWFGDTGGSDWRQQTVSEMPKHKHTYWFNNPPAPFHQDGIGPTESVPDGSRVGTDGYGYTTNQGDTADTTFNGLNWGMGIQPPYYVLTYIMKL